MKRKEDIQKELTGISPTMAAYSNETPFEAPASYFDTFPVKMLELINHLEKNTSLPAAEETAILSPFLTGLKNKESFQVPGNYFEDFEKRITKHLDVPATEPAKVVRMNTTSRKTRVRYAIAAAVTGFIGLTAFLFWNNLQPDANQSLAAKSSSVIDSISVPEVSSETLAKYLNGLPGSANDGAIDSIDSEFYEIALLKIDDAKLVNMLHEVPDEDLTFYEGEL